MKLLIVGGGSIGERHLRCFQQVGAGHVALCETSAPRRQEIADHYGVAEAFGSVEESARRNWDAAVICTPAHLHVPHARLLLPRTAALLIEKPLATRLAEAEALVEAARGNLVSVAYVYRAHPAVDAVRELLTAGRLGRLLQVVVVAGQHFPTFRPAYRDTYYADRLTGGGAVQDAATHLFDLAQYLAGRFDWVFCDYAHQALEGVSVEDTVHLTARANQEQVLVTVAVNQFMAPNETTVQLNGSLASARIHFHEHRYAVLAHGDPAWQWSEPLVHDRDDLFCIQARRFLDLCAGRSPPACSLQDALGTLQVNLAALESAGVRRVPIEARTAR
jgi:predicted dehydrogenase